MCNLYNLKATRWELDAAFSAASPNADELEKEYVAPGRQGYVVRETAGSRVLDRMRWGFPPPVAASKPVVNVRTTRARSGAQPSRPLNAAASCRSLSSKSGRLNPTQRQAKSALIGSRYPRGVSSPSRASGGLQAQGAPMRFSRAGTMETRLVISSARCIRRRAP
jgi:hypothetical protein